ncbi:hypothetical protein WKW80_24175 [Variovorax humicola]|uniref:Uncharacterized protein n=1 Tax=Variovorax humicola TaxID=1769758 RepID=A0ABU8W5B3_9BURK
MTCINAAHCGSVRHSAEGAWRSAHLPPGPWTTAWWQGCLQQPFELPDLVVAANEGVRGGTGQPLADGASRTLHTAIAAMPCANASQDRVINVESMYIVHDDIAAGTPVPVLDEGDLRSTLRFKLGCTCRPRCGSSSLAGRTISRR